VSVAYLFDIPIEKTVHDYDYQRWKQGFYSMKNGQTLSVHKNIPFSDLNPFQQMLEIALPLEDEKKSLVEMKNFSMVRLVMPDRDVQIAYSPTTEKEKILETNPYCRINSKINFVAWFFVDQIFGSLFLFLLKKDKKSELLLDDKW